MDRFVALDEIAFGDIDADAAYRIIRPILESSDEKSAQRIYVILRSWLWKALNERRRDADLREWFNVLRAVSAYFKKEGLLQAERVRTLYELLHESIAVPEVMPKGEILERSHVQDILIMLKSAPKGTLPRATILETLGFKQANLSRIMNLLLSNGLVERHVEGKNASFSLTLEGTTAAEKIVVKRESHATATASLYGEKRTPAEQSNAGLFTIIANARMSFRPTASHANRRDIVIAQFASENIVCATPQRKYSSKLDAKKRYATERDQSSFSLVQFKRSEVRNDRKNKPKIESRAFIQEHA